MAQSADKLRIDFHKPAHVKGTFVLHIFQDHDHLVGYIPSLNLTSYGETSQEVVDRLMKDVCNDFFDNLTSLGPVKAAKELEKLGWRKLPFLKKRFVSDSYVDKNGVLKNFNLPEETPIDTRVVTV